MKLTLPLAAALLVGSGALVAVQAMPLTDSISSSNVVQVAAKSTKHAKTHKMPKAVKKPKSQM